MNEQQKTRRDELAMERYPPRDNFSTNGRHGFRNGYDACAKNAKVLEVALGEIVGQALRQYGSEKELRAARGPMAPLLVMGLEALKAWRGGGG